MSNLGVGQMVVLVADLGGPPVGAVGEVLRGVDWEGDYLVDFPGHPCMVPDEDGPYWFCQRSELMPINFGPQLVNQETEQYA